MEGVLLVDVADLTAGADGLDPTEGFLDLLADPLGHTLPAAAVRRLWAAGSRASMPVAQSRSAKPVAWVRSASTMSPLRFSIRRWPM